MFEIDQSAIGIILFLIVVVMCAVFKKRPENSPDRSQEADDEFESILDNDLLRRYELEPYNDPKNIGEDR